jgi:hypothetical protein
MNLPTLIVIKRLLNRKLAVILLITGSAAAAFATLGDGKSLATKSKKALLSGKSNLTSGFSLKSGYAYRGNQVFSNKPNRFVNTNTIFSYQKGHTTYVLPLKKKVILENVKIDLSNRQLRRN